MTMPSDEDRELVEQALHAADTGNAGHWPTVAGILADEVRRLRVIVATDPAGPSYVVVTTANNGVVHAWGTDEGEPFDNRNSAGTLVRKLRRLDSERGQDSTDVRMSVCKILGKPPSESDGGVDNG